MARTYRRNVSPAFQRWELSALGECSQIEIWGSQGEASPRLSATQKAEAKKLKADIARLEKELAKKRARLAQLGG